MTIPSARQLGVPRIVHLPVVSSTMDEAHKLALSGALSGTCVLADAQTAGRGRSGKQWVSEAGRGVWLTIIERDFASPDALAGVEVLSLRIGVAIAKVLEKHDTESRFSLKWPNDVFRNGEKVAGVLVEARWREGYPEWVAIGVGINLERPIAFNTAGALGGVSSDATDGAATAAGGVDARLAKRFELLMSLVPALREAALTRGSLSDEELSEWNDRDMALGKRVVLPVSGRVSGVTPRGALLVEMASGSIEEIRSGSLVLEG